MGKISLFQSSERLTTDSPSVRVSPQLAGQFGRDLQGVGNAITQANQTIRKAYDFQQLGTAKAKTIEGTDAMTQRAIEDGDNTGDLTSYENEFGRLRADASSGITNPATRAKFQIDFDLQAAQTRTKIKSIFWNRMKEKGIANMRNVNTALTTEYAETGDKAIFEAIDLNIDSYTKQGFIGADTAQKIKANAIETARESKLVWDINNNFKDVETNLKNNTYGFDLDQLKNANALYNSEKNRVQNEKEEELDQMSFDNQLNEHTVDAYVKNKWVEPKIGNAWKKALEAEEANNPDRFKYNSMLERAAQISRNNKSWFKTTKEKEDVFKQATLLRQDVLEARGKKQFTRQDAIDILEKMGKSFDDFRPYQDGILRLQNFTNVNYTPQEKDIIKQELYRDFMNLVGSGTDPVEAVDIAKQNLYPQYNYADLIYTADETGLTIAQVVDLLNKKAGEAK